MKNFTFKVEVDGDSMLEITTASLQNSYDEMVRYLKDYESNTMKFMSVFSTDKEEDMKQLLQMKDALVTVAKWYGVDLAPAKKSSKKKSD
jgi:hypothetical protein